MTDEEIAKRILDKDMTVFEYIMAHYNKLLWLVIGNILEKVGTAEDVEDCISEVYLKLLANPKLYDYRKGSLKSLLVKIGKNQAIDRYRKLSKSNVIVFHELSDSQEATDVLHFVVTKENKERVFAAVNSLKEPDKEIMIRRFYFSEKPKEISEKMSLSVKVVENKLYQGKMKLKSILE